MASDLDLIARLLAYFDGKARLIASKAQITLQPHAVILCPLAMAGEDTTIHIVAIGRAGGPPEIRAVADPRVRDDQFGLFQWAGSKIEAYFEDCRKLGDYPQIWVSSAAAASHLDVLADRLRYNRDNTAVRRFGELLSYATERFPVPGQQALMTATGALRPHYATGQQDGEDEHLGALLTWIDPPNGKDVLIAVARAEEEPMGVKTDPTFDKNVLAPLVAAFNEARHGKASVKILELHRKSIEQALEPIVLRIYEGIQKAVSILSSVGLPDLPGVPALAARERDEFDGFMTARDNGIPLPLRDKPKGAAFRLADREDASQNVESAIVHGDGVGRARARLSGDCLVGQVRNPQRLHIGPRRFRHLFEIVSNQRVLRIRRRDELVLLSDPRLAAIVHDVRRTARTTVVSLEITAGSRSVGLPVNGSTIEMGPHAPQWDRIIRLRIQMKSRLTSTPWTHLEDVMPVAVPQTRPAPADLLPAIEALS